MVRMMVWIKFNICFQYDSVLHFLMTWLDFFVYNFSFLRISASYMRFLCYMYDTPSKVIKRALVSATTFLHLKRIVVLANIVYV